MGSEIINPETGEVLWGHPAGLIHGSENLRLALPVDPGEDPAVLEASAPILTMGGVDVYAGMVETLTSMGGYTLATPSNPTPPAPCLEFAYDWRLGCEENAARLSAYLTSVERSYGDPALKVDLVAHSMGGLIARYFILYGGENVLGLSDPRPNWAGAMRVRKLVMLGTPNAGSAEAVLALIHGRRVGLARMPPDLLATMPSMFELMPPPGIPTFFTPDGRPAPLDLYDIATWKDQAWGIFDPRQTSHILRRYATIHPKATAQRAEEHLTALKLHFEVLLGRAAAFHRALHAGALPRSVPTLLLGGDCTPTPRGLVVERESGRWVVRQRPEEVQRPVKGVNLWKIFFGPGDGHVTKASLLDEMPAAIVAEARTALPYALSGFVCAKHMNLVKNWTFRDNLLHFLLYTPLPAALGHPPDEKGQIPTPL
jgi:pimeloyl-ACP methyl ester carboxylesterase